MIDERHHTEANQAVALEAALKSLVLLKNDDALLPLSKDIQKVAVIGPMANEGELGGYAVRGEKEVITVFEGVKQVLGDNAEVSYAEGVPLIYKGQVIPSANLYTKDKSQSGLEASFFNNRNLEGNRIATN